MERSGASFIYLLHERKLHEQFKTNKTQSKHTRPDETLARRDRGNSYCRQISVITKLNEENKSDIKVNSKEINDKEKTPIKTITILIMKVVTRS